MIQQLHKHFIATIQNRLAFDFVSQCVSYLVNIGRQWCRDGVHDIGLEELAKGHISHNRLQPQSQPSTAVAAQR